ncbi:PAS domain-containing protein [Methanomethylovorans sp.]|uniref:PAS domain-containing protein n=1 Tax=Methanomethylovorans sp. TaxID=2758717 RepID=UPI00351C771D
METNTEKNACTIEKELSKEELLYALEKQKDAFEKLKVLESIINGSPFIALSRDASKDFSVVFISENISQFGYKAEDLMCKMTYPDIIQPDEREYVKLELIENCREGSKYITLKYRIMTKKGEARPVEEKIFIQRDPQGNPMYLQSIIFETDAKCNV